MKADHNTITPFGVKVMSKYKELSKSERVVIKKLVKHTRVTRASNRQDFYLSGGKHKVLYTDSFAYSGAIIWNNLSPSIHNCSNLNQFKSAYLNDYFS